MLVALFRSFFFFFFSVCLFVSLFVSFGTHCLVVVVFLLLSYFFCGVFLLVLFRRVAFSSILESVRGTPFPIPRAFFRTGVSPRVALSALPPAPAAGLTGPDGVAADGTGSAPWGGQPPPPSHQQAFDDFRPPLSSSPVAMVATADEPGGSGGGGMSVGEKRQRRDGGAGARYYGPSCRLRADVAEAERSRRPRLPLISAAQSVSTAAGSSPPLSHSSRPRNSGGGGGGPRRNPSCLSFSASEAWWAQLVKEEVMLAAAAAAPSGQAGVGAGGTWRAHAVGQTGGPGVWLLQGTVCRGRGTGGVLPAVSEVGWFLFVLWCRVVCGKSINDRMRCSRY